MQPIDTTLYPDHRQWAVRILNRFIAGEDIPVCAISMACNGLRDPSTAEAVQRLQYERGEARWRRGASPRSTAPSRPLPEPRPVEGRPWWQEGNP